MWQEWLKRCEAAARAFRALGAEEAGVSHSEPATEQQIRAVEQRLKTPLPPSFRAALKEFAAAFEFSWTLPEDAALPPELEEVQFGTCAWDLHALEEMDQARREWLEEVFDDEDDPYAQVYRNKLVFMSLPNGDLLAFDLAHGPDYPVVYLSHDGGECHGYVLGNSFADFMDRWTAIGCPGPETWVIEPFVSSPQSGLEPNGENARAWRAWAGLDG